MKLQQIRTTDEAHYAFVEKVLVDSFPQNEYRDLPDFRDFTDNNPLFHNNIILENDRLAGMITYWDFSDFYYIEHFAIDKSMRGKGYGAYSLFLLKRMINKPLVLEVELPVKEQSLRRIRFYQRQGFSLMNNYYEQPPYRPSDNSYPMLIMVYDEKGRGVDFKAIRSTIYREVYGVKS